MRANTRVLRAEQTSTPGRGASRWRATGLGAVAAALAAAGTALAAPPPVPVTQFDMTGFLQAATLDPPGDVLSGGTLTVNGQVVVVPRNVVVVMPAAFLSWQQLFAKAPPPYGPGQTGLAMADSPAPFVPYEVHVVGNRVANGAGDRYIAGLVSVSQQSLNSGQGYINFIDYGTGEIRVGGVLGDATTGQRVRLNDPLGKFGRASTTDPRFTIDEDNPTVRTSTGFPMCIPRSDPAAGPDPLCPQSNRPADPATGGFAMIFNMPATKDVVPNGPDPMLEAPFEVGDWVSYAGTLVKDGSQPTVGPNPSLSTGYVSAWQVIANVGIYTAPGTDPVFVAVDVTILGTGGINQAGVAEATIRTRFEGFMSDPFRLPGTDPTCSDANFKVSGQPCAAVDLFGIDVDPCTATQKDRPWGAIDVDPGPPNGAVPGRWRFRPPGRTLPLAGATGQFVPATQQVHAVVRGATPTLTKNGILAGQYQAPITEYLFPENAATGTPIVANNFESMPFLVNGLGPLDGPGSPSAIVGQLSPWPGDPTPAATPGTCAPVSPSQPTADAGANQTVSPGALVTLDGSKSADPGGAALTYAWTAPSGITLSDPTAQKPTFTAPTPTTNSQSLVFTLVVTNAGGTASPPATTTVTVNNPAVAKDVVTITTVEYRKDKQRLTVNATSSNAAAQLTLKGYAGLPDTLLTIQAGVPTAILVGVPQPTTVTVTSNLGGSATSGITRLR
jgi:K319-like protein